MEEKDEQKLPLYNLQVDMDDMYSGMDAISFVDRPAIEVNWNTFNEEKKKSLFEVTNEDRRIVTGPVMLADTPIFRYNDVIGAYEVQFTKEKIFDMSIKYFKENKIHEVNLQHDSKRKVDKVTLFEYFIIERGNKTDLYPDLPDGSVMASFLVENEDVWKSIKDGEFNGFSLEGWFNEELTMSIENKILDKKKEEMEMMEELFYLKFKDIVNSNEADVVKEYKLRRLFS